MTDNDSILDNIEVHKNFAIVSVNPKLYPLSVIYSAAYWLLDRVHVIIDGDPETEILIEIRPKDKDKPVDLKKIGYEFNDELINYAVYTVQATRNKNLREMVVRNALAGNLSNTDVSAQPQEFIPNQPVTQPVNEPVNQPVNQQAEAPLIPVPQTRFAPTTVQRAIGEMSSAWQPGEQPIDDNMQKILDENTAPTKDDEMFKGTEGVDTENVTAIKNYRHSSSEFRGTR